MSDKDSKVPDQVSGEDADEDKTILFQPKPVGDEAAPAATPAPAPGEDEDDERTVIAGAAPPAGAPAAAEPAADDPAPEAAGAPAEEDDNDRTVVITERRGAGDAPEPAEAATILATDPGPGAGAGPVTHTATASVVPPPPGSEPTPLSSLEPGLVINNMYRVEERLDQGGMGRVFRGTEIGTGESVAIKVILPEMAEDTKVTDMFRREARVLRQLHHDAIVRYFAYVPPDQNLNLHALVMGFIQGTKLSDTLKDGGPLKRKQVIKLTMRLADGLARAHDIGVVHRDLSPDNVMLQDGDIGKAVLIDFGISRSSTVKDVTIGADFAGKLKYVSPEQMGAFGGEAEGPSDVYSLGLLMVAMLLGKPMDMGSNFVDAVQKRQEVPDLSDIPEEFQPLIHEMLLPDPKERLPGMTAVIEALRAMEGGDGTGLSFTRNRNTAPPVEPDRAVAGLQAVPIAATSSAAGTRTTPPTEVIPPEVPKSGGRGLMLALLLIAAVGAGAGYMFRDDLSALIAGPSDGGGGGETAQGLERVPGTRATFLAENVPAGCTFAARRAQGPNAGLLEGFADDPARLGGLATAFGAAFGSAPEVLPRSVTPPQCAVLEFAHALQGTQGSGIELAMATNRSSRSEGVQGVVHGSAGRNNWLALIDPNGQVFSLMRQFDDPIGDERRFAFRLPTAAPGTYMLVATASDSALVRAGAMRDGTDASDIFPLMTTEIAEDGQGAVDIAILELTP